MKTGFSLIMVLSFLCLGITSCNNDRNTGSDNKGNPAEKTDAQTPDVVEDLSFEAYLQEFQSDDQLANWSSGIMEAFYNSPDFYSGDEKREAFLKSEFSLLRKSADIFIPTDNIINLDPKYSKNIEDPINSFDFWAARKLKQEGYWLVAILAVKKAQKDKEFHAHPLLLVTYDLEDNTLDSYVWTFFADDTEQIWDDIAVEGETLIRGYKGSSESSDFSEIYTKTSITPEGIFKTETTKKSE